MKYQTVQYFDKDGKYHRLDGPAYIGADGTKVWWVNGELHREDGPAVIYADGYKEWWVNGKLHRLDGPAVIGADGSKEWWINGNHHGYDEEPPESYLKELKSLGIKFVRGSDNPPDYPE